MNGRPGAPARLTLTLALAWTALAAPAWALRGGPARRPAQSELGDSALPVGQVGGVSRVLVSRGELLWAGLGPRVVAIDARDPLALRVVGRSGWLDSVVAGLALDGDLAVAVTVGGQLHVLDVSEPTAPRRIGGMALSEVPQVIGDEDRIMHTPVAFARGFAYALWSKHDAAGRVVGTAVAVVDVRAPDAPRIVWSSLTPADLRVLDLVVAGSVLAVATVPEEAEQRAWPTQLALRLYDLADPAMPALVAIHADPGWASLAVAPGADGRPLVYGYWVRGLALDIADPRNPQVVARYGRRELDDTPFDANWLTIGPGGRMFVAQAGGFGDGLLQEVLREPATAGNFRGEAYITAFSGYPSGGFAALGDLVALAQPGGRIGLYSQEAGNNERLRSPVATLDIPGSLEGVALAGGGPGLLATTHQGGLWPLNAAGRAADPQPGASLWDGAYHDGLVAREGLAVVGYGGEADVMDSACDVFDLGSPDRPVKTARLEGGCAWADFDLVGKSLYAGAGLSTDDDLMKVLDLTDPRSPREVGQVRVGGPLSGLAADARRLAVAHFAGGYLGQAVGPLSLALFDRSGSGLPVLLGDGTLEVPAGLRWNQPKVVLAGDTAYLLSHLGSTAAERQDYLATLSLTDPARPRTLATLRLPGAAEDFTAQAGYLFIPQGEGVLIADVRDPAAPRIVGTLAAPASLDAAAVAVSEGLVYVAAGTEGLYVFRPDLDWPPEVHVPTPPPTAEPPGVYPPTPWPTLTPGPPSTPWPPLTREPVYLPLAVADH